MENSATVLKFETTQSTDEPQSARRDKSTTDTERQQAVELVMRADAETLRYAMALIEQVRLREKCHAAASHAETRILRPEAFGR